MNATVPCSLHLTFLCCYVAFFFFFNIDCIRTGQVLWPLLTPFFSVLHRNQQKGNYSNGTPTPPQYGLHQWWQLMTGGGGGGRGAEFRRVILPAKALASSVGTARRWRRSDLLPTSMMTMFWSAWSRSSFSHRSTFSYVKCLAMSYTNSAPTAPR